MHKPMPQFNSAPPPGSIQGTVLIYLEDVVTAVSSDLINGSATGR
jgi:hypothetical protein